ncbi:MAG: metallophosphoesterase family protein [Anaerolineae bacterium]
MRLAVLSDIHGNLHALEAVLQDLAQAGGADLIWILGDLVAFGPDPRGCLAAIRALPEETTRVIQGNTDRYVTTWARPHAEKPTAETWPQYVQMMMAREANFAWTSQQLTGEEAEYLLKLGTDLTENVAGYGRVVGFHAGPDDDEMVLLPYTPDDIILDALLVREGRLALGGHTHKPMDRDLGTWRFVNPGSVGLPFDGDQRAAYAVLTFEGGAVEVAFRRAAYDVDAAIAALEACGNPGSGFAIERLKTASPPH